MAAEPEIIRKRKRGRPPKNGIAAKIPPKPPGHINKGEPGNRIFPTKKNAAGVLGVPLDWVILARDSGCDGFNASGHVKERHLKPWLEKHRAKLGAMKPDTPKDTTGGSEDDEADSGDGPDSQDRYGIGQSLLRMQKQEFHLSKQVDKMVKFPDAYTQDGINKAISVLTRLQLGLLKFETTLDENKRARGEMVPKADVLAHVQALVAWWMIGEATARNNFILEAEGKNRFQMDEIIKREEENSILYALKTGVSLGKFPQWMKDACADLILWRDETPVKSSPSTKKQPKKIKAK